MEKELLNSKRQLLLVDLSARLPYGIKIHGNFRWGSEDEIFDDIQTKVLNIYDIDWLIHGTEIKPYLFPISSMTEEQLLELASISFENSIDSSIKTLDWLNKNKFDYRGLIPMGLALDATGLNIY